ncbi:MAG: penicillin-binding protein 2, partial [Actinomycetia bacterium]|nr:penicillin-binding protein 2 [Actinomycetes bacterium]
KLAKYLIVPKEELEKKIGEAVINPLRPVIIKENLTLEEISYLREHKTEFPGVDVVISAVRNYLFSNLAAHLIGNMGEITDQELEGNEFSDCELGDVIGKTGVERVFDDKLRGIKGIKEVEVNALGDLLRVIKEEEPLPGYDVVLTIEKELQKKTEDVLKEAINYANREGYQDANGGVILVLNPQNGEVLSMASYPTYFPESFIEGLSQEEWDMINSEESNYPLFNRAVAASYPPGSIFKPFTLIAGLQEGLIDSSSVFFCDGRWEGMGESWPKYCWKRTGHGRIGLSNGIAESCDVVFYDIGYKFYKSKEEDMQKWARVFGFDEKTGIDLTSETEGRVPDKEWKNKWFENPQQQVWLPGDSVNMSIGQGDMLATPIQIGLAYSSIINGGVLYKPGIVKALINTRDSRTYLNKPEINRKIEITPFILSLTKKALKKVITEGTAKDAFAGFSISIGGKTGTSEVSGKDDFAWFVCFAPYENPEYLIVVLVEEGGHGGSVAALAAKKILSFLFNVPYSTSKKVNDVSR